MGHTGLILHVITYKWHIMGRMGSVMIFIEALDLKPVYGQPCTGCTATMQEKGTIRTIEER
jgi:hypothetical protein